MGSIGAACRPAAMSRRIIRDWKRSISIGLQPQAEPPAALLAKESALSLLQRSVSFGHGRLAILRLAIAVQSGADVPAAHWSYCRNAASASGDQTLQTLLERAESAAQTLVTSQPTP
ncbi:MAG TPA: hypothetical protein VNU48_01465 [Burkholderiaceae bacterium]|nr:hypothetical protein [Burkholderiaceae bacterium]